MIAEIYGKLSSSGSNLTERLEDQLTGDVFGVLRYVRYSNGLLPILKSGYYVENGERHSLELNDLSISEIRFWPWLEGVEPDLMIKATTNGDLESVILMEVKYNSPLSGDDQLVRQLRAMWKKHREHRRILIYLTADRCFPRDLFDRVKAQAIDQGIEDPELYWLSWHDVLICLEEKLVDCSEMEQLIVNDLLGLFKKKGFERFSQLESLTSLPSNAPSLALPLPLGGSFTEMTTTLFRPERRVPDLQYLSLTEVREVRFPQIGGLHNA